MAKKPFNVENFLKLSSEEQAKVIERETEKLLSRLPSLKKKLTLYNDTSDEMYNLGSDEVQMQGITWARAVRQGEITTSSGKSAYRHFIRNLTRYARTDIAQLALESAQKRMDSWFEHVEKGSTIEGIEYAQELLSKMTDEQKLGFTRSKYYMDSTYMYMVTLEDGQQYPIQVLKLELYCREVCGIETDNIYFNKVKKDKTTPLRPYHKHRKKG